MNELLNLCKDKDWFSEIDTDVQGRHIVYTNYINANVLAFVPSTLNGKQVLVHFVAYKKAEQDYWVNTLKVEARAFNHDNDEVNLSFLVNELERLENKSSQDIITDIFFEINDGDNAITNSSAKHPDIRKKMEKLYDVFGFDLLYERLGE